MIDMFGFVFWGGWLYYETSSTTGSASKILHAAHQKCYASNGASILQQSGELALLGLEVAVAANVLLLDVDIGHATLARDFLQGVLDRGSVVLEFFCQFVGVKRVRRGVWGRGKVKGSGEKMEEAYAPT